MLTLTLEFTPITKVLVDNILDEGNEFKSYAHVRVLGPRVFNGLSICRTRGQRQVTLLYMPIALLLLTPLLCALSWCGVLKIYLPHLGGRVLRIVHRLCRMRGYIDDGMGAIAGLTAYRGEKLSGSFITFSQFDRVFHENLTIVHALSLSDYVGLLCDSSRNSYELPPWGENTRVAVLQSNSLDKKAWRNILEHYEPHEVVCFLHPYSFKNRDIPDAVTSRIPPASEGVEVFFPHLMTLEEVVVGRSFSALAFLAFIGRVDKPVITLTINPSVDHKDALFMDEYQKISGEL